MAFTRSSRFSDTATCAPPPTAYQLPSAFDETSCNTLTVPSCVHPQIKISSDDSPCLTENKENVCCAQKKEVSKFTKNSKLTEPKAPSFMTRRYTIHNCLTNSTEENDSPKSNFNRNSIKRKSMKIIKEKKEKTSEKLDSSLSPSTSAHTSNLQANKHLNVSYTVIGGKPNKEGIHSCPGLSTGNKGGIPKQLCNITDDMKQNESLKNLDFGSTEDNAAESTDYSNLEDSSEKVLLEKDDVQKVFLNNLGTENETTDPNDTSKEADCVNYFLPQNPVEHANIVKRDIDNAVGARRISINHDSHSKSSTSITETDSHVVFLVTDEFIDDEFDSYVDESALKKKEANGKDFDITKMCKSLVQLHMEKLSVKVPKKKVILKRNKSRVKKGSQNLAKKRTSTISTNMLESEVEKIVRTAINNLKEEFRNEVFKKTEEKVDALMSKLAAVLLKADESINDKCEHTASGLISNLEKLIN